MENTRVWTIAGEKDAQLYPQESMVIHSVINSLWITEK